MPVRSLKGMGPISDAAHGTRSRDRFSKSKTYLQRWIQGSCSGVRGLKPATNAISLKGMTAPIYWCAIAES